MIPGGVSSELRGDVHDPWMRLFGAPRGLRVEITTAELPTRTPHRELEETPRQLRDAPPIKVLPTPLWPIQNGKNMTRSVMFFPSFRAAGPGRAGGLVGAHVTVHGAKRP